MYSILQWPVHLYFYEIKRPYPDIIPRDSLSSNRKASRFIECITVFYRTYVYICNFYKTLHLQKNTKISRRLSRQSTGNFMGFFWILRKKKNDIYFCRRLCDDCWLYSQVQQQVNHKFLREKKKYIYPFLKSKWSRQPGLRVRLGIPDMCENTNWKSHVCNINSKKVFGICTRVNTCKVCKSNIPRNKL